MFRILAALALFAAILLTAYWSLSQALDNVECDSARYAACETACDLKGWLGLLLRGAGLWILLAAVLSSVVLARKIWTATKRRKTAVETEKETAWTAPTGPSLPSQ